MGSSAEFLDVQVKYSVLDRKAEESGLLAACGQLGVTLVAHSPLEQGLLTERSLSEGTGKRAEQVLGCPSSYQADMSKLLLFVRVCSLQDRCSWSSKDRCSCRFANA